RDCTHCSVSFCFLYTPPTAIYTLSLHDALPISLALVGIAAAPALVTVFGAGLQGQSRALAVALMRILFPMSGLMVISAWCLGVRSEEHTSELQSRFDLVCRLLLEKKKERWKRCISRLIQTIAPLVSVTCGIKMQL